MNDHERGSSLSEKEMFNVEKKKEYSADLDEMEPSVKARRGVGKFDKIKSLNINLTRAQGC